MWWDVRRIWYIWIGEEKKLISTWVKGKSVKFSSSTLQHEKLEIFTCFSSSFRCRLLVIVILEGKISNEKVEFKFPSHHKILRVQFHIIFSSAICFFRVLLTFLLLVVFTHLKALHLLQEITSEYIYFIIGFSSIFFPLNSLSFFMNRIMFHVNSQVEYEMRKTNQILQYHHPSLLLLLYPQLPLPPLQNEKIPLFSVFLIKFSFVSLVNAIVDC